MAFSHDKASTNQADLFHSILQWENQGKHMSLYRDGLQNQVMPLL